MLICTENRDVVEDSRKRIFYIFWIEQKKVDFEEINSVQNSSHSITIFSARTLFNLLFFYMFFSLFFTNQKHFKIHKLFPALISTPLNLKNLLYFFVPYTLSLSFSIHQPFCVFDKQQLFSWSRKRNFGGRTHAGMQQLAVMHTFGSLYFFFVFRSTIPTDRDLALRWNEHLFFI